MNTQDSQSHRVVEVGSGLWSSSSPSSLLEQVLYFSALYKSPLSLTCLHVFQLKVTLHVAHCSAVNEKCYLMHGLEDGGVWEPEV